MNQQNENHGSLFLNVELTFWKSNQPQACFSPPIADLTDAEKEAVLVLRKDGGAGDAAEGGSDAAEMTLVQKIRAGKRKQREETVGETQYHDSNFILASAAEVERLWSHAGLVLTKARRGMTPMLLEAILFLKFNRRFWDQNLVSEAYAMNRSARSQKRISDDAEQQDLGAGDTTDEALA